MIEHLTFNNEYLSENDSNNKRISRFITLNISRCFTQAFEDLSRVLSKGFKIEPKTFRIFEFYLNSNFLNPIKDAAGYVYYFLLDGEIFCYKYTYEP